MAGASELSVYLSERLLSLTTAEIKTSGLMDIKPDVYGLDY